MTLPWPRVAAALLALVSSAGPLPAAARKPGAATPARPDSEAPWKVEDAHGPSRMLSFSSQVASSVDTLYPAQTLGLDRDLGSIEKGKLADFVVLEKNPLEKIENTDSVTLVVKNGRAYTPRELERRPEDPS